MRRCLILLLAVLAGCVSTSDDETTPASSEPTIAEKLVTLGGGDSDPAQYDAALGQLSSRCADHPDTERVADMAVVSRDKLSEVGISESLLEILQHVNEAIPESGDPDQGCAVYFGSYVFLRRGGQ
jgi:hypothetical protein